MSQLEILKRRIPEETDDELLTDMLESAKAVILSRRYPVSEYPVDAGGIPVLESRFIDLQIRIAVELYTKIGAEGQLAHNENGINRSYENGSGVSDSLLREITPMVGVPK